MKFKKYDPYRLLVLNILNFSIDLNSFTYVQKVLATISEKAIQLLSRDTYYQCICSAILELTCASGTCAISRSCIQREGDCHLNGNQASMKKKVKA
jgi:hypothetical protein